MNPDEYRRGKYVWAGDDVEIVEEGGEETASGLWPGTVQAVADGKAEETAVEDTGREQ